MERTQRRRIGSTLATAALLLLGVAFAPPAAAVNQSDGYAMELDSVVYDSEADTTTYTWSLDHASRTDAASHLVIDTCLGETATGTDPEADDYNGPNNPDPTTGTTGYKWENDPAVGSTYSITFAGEWGEGGESTWAVKKGGGYVTGTTAGPSCEQVQAFGSFVVAKTVEGPYSGDKFAFDVACGPDESEIIEASTIEGEEVEAAFQETIELAHGESKTYADLPAGWVCSAEETDSNGAAAVLVSDTTTPTGDGIVVIGANATSRVDVTNQYAAVVDPGSLRVSKTVSGTSADSFPFTVACTNGGAAVTLAAGDASFSLAHGQNKVISAIPAGSSCTVTETDDKGAVSTTIADSSGTATDGVVTIASNAQSTVDFTNTMAEVQGVVFSRAEELPRTGATTTGLAAIALLLLASGMVMVFASHRETELQP